MPGILLNAEAGTVGAIVENVGTVFTSAMTWAGSVGTKIVETPLLLTFTVVPLVGLGVGLFKRLINIR